MSKTDGSDRPEHGEPRDDAPIARLLAVLRRVTVVGGGALGATLIAASALAPTAVIGVIHLGIADEPADVARLLHVRPRTVVLLYGVTLVLGATALQLFSTGFERALDSDRLRRGLTLRFLIAASFAIAFVGTRTLVTLSGVIRRGGAGRIGALPVREFWLWSYHIHHFYFGFALLALAGWLALLHREVPPWIPALGYGLGMGIFVDEIGMLLTNGDYYALSTYFVAVTFAALLLVGFYWTVQRDGGSDAPGDRA